MKKVNLLSKAEMKSVVGGGVCEDGDQQDYAVCYNCCLHYMYELDQPDDPIEWDEVYNPENICSEGC